MTDRDPIHTKLDSIEQKLDAANKHLVKLNGKVARHDQTLYGIAGGDGLASDVRDLKRQARPVGTVPMRTVWTALASLAAVGSLIVALTIGLT